MNTGYLYQDEKKYEKSIKWFEKAAELNGPKAAEARYWIADSYELSGKKDTAAKNYIKVYKEYPKSGEWAITALNKAAKIYEEKGRLKKAISTYRMVLKASKDKRYTVPAKKMIKLLEEQYRLMNPVGETGPVKKKSPSAGGVKK